MSAISTKGRGSLLSALGGINESGPKWEANHPTPHLSTIIELLWSMLDQVRSDWDREVRPRQQACDAAKTTDERLILAATAAGDLQTCFLKCLFSYITFFTSAWRAYRLFYGDLNRLNRLPVFRVGHTKLPEPDAYIKKVQMVRNIALVHFGTTQASEADSVAGLLWHPVLLSMTPESCDLDRITFRPGRVVVRDHSGTVIGEAADLEINGMHELDDHCAAFLRRCDEACADYLGTLHSRLPCESGGCSYKRRRDEQRSS